MLPGTEQDRPHGQVQLVDQARAQILPNRGYSASHTDVTPARGGACLLQRRMNAFRDEPKLRPSRHLERRSRMMGEHEDRRVIRWLLSPPALPAVIRPGTADGPEHVPPENPGPDSGEGQLSHVVVDARL